MLHKERYILSFFLPRCMECQRELATRKLSVRLSLCPSVCQTRGFYPRYAYICTVYLYELCTQLRLTTVFKE